MEKEGKEEKVQNPLSETCQVFPQRLVGLCTTKPQRLLGAERGNPFLDRSTLRHL